MYTYLDQQYRQQFDLVATYRQTDQKTVQRLRHKMTRADFVLRKYQGDAACYEKLLPIESPYLPKILEVASLDSSVLVLEEFVDGDSVAEMLKETLFTEKETRRIALDICRGLYVLHSLGIVHRDVKPENMILHEDRAVLLDFDAARIVKETVSADTHVLGTTGFAAPEQYGLSQTDSRADIYALGVSINLLLTGEHPSNRLAPGRFGRIVTRCTMVQPAKRYRSIKQLMEVL